MLKLLLLILFLFLFDICVGKTFDEKINQPTIIVSTVDTVYEPTWESLDARPLPNWYDNAKVGIFIHWGVYSVPAFGTEWFWTNWKDSKAKSYVEFMNKNYKPGFTYQEFAQDFTAENFDPSEWAKLFEESGAK